MDVWHQSCIVFETILSLMSSMKKETTAGVITYLERTIADRTQGDDAIHSLKHVLKETIDTVNNVSDIIPSFNIICFMFTFLLEAEIFVYKKDIVDILNKYLFFYDDKLLHTDYTYDSISEMDKFLDILVLSYSQFVDKYSVNEEQIQSLQKRLRHSLKKTSSATYSPVKKQHLARQSAHKNTSNNRYTDFQAFDYNAISFHQQIYKYMHLQNTSNKNNDQVEFLNLTSLNNYSLDLNGEVMFYLNFFNYNNESNRFSSDNNNINFRFLNYLNVSERAYDERIYTKLVRKDARYKSFALINQFFILRSFKEKDFILKLFNEGYSLTNGDILLSSLLNSRRVMYMFLDQLISFIKQKKLSDDHDVNYEDDTILQYVDTCFLLCFKLQTCLDEMNKNLNSIELKKVDMENLVKKLFFEDYLESSDNYDESSLYHYYIKNHLMSRKFNVFGNNIKEINVLENSMTAAVLEILVDLDT